MESFNQHTKLKQVSQNFPSWIFCDFDILASNQYVGTIYVVELKPGISLHFTTLSLSLRIWTLESIAKIARKYTVTRHRV